MEKLILRELKSKLGLRDRIFIFIFKKKSIKIYKIGIEKGVNIVL